MNKKNILIVFLCLVIVLFGYFSYRQNQTIDVLNREVIRQAHRSQKLILENYGLKKEVKQARKDTAKMNDADTKPQ